MCIRKNTVGEKYFSNYLEMSYSKEEKLLRSKIGKKTDFQKVM